MFRNTLTIAFRTLLRNKEYALINILGLAVSIASCLLLFGVLRFETSFDTYHRNAASLYRVTSNFYYPDGEANTPGVPPPGPEAFRTDFPQTVHQASLYNVPNMVVTVASDGQPVKHFKQEKGAFYIEPEFFEMFDFKWLHGKPSVLSETNTAVIDRVSAEKFFGSWQDAIGKSITVDETTLVKIAGIIETPPENSDFPVSVAVSFKTRKEPDQSWGSFSGRRQHYMQLEVGTNPDQIAKLFPAFEKKHIQGIDNPAQFRLQPLATIHFDYRYSNLNNRTIDKSTLAAFGVIALFLLLTASINFINLAIAQVVKKSKEVGVRKVLGSLKQQLIAQFLGETVVILMVAAVISLILAQTLLPILQPILFLPPSFSIFTLDTLIFLPVVIVVLTVFAGAYPALVMSRFKPVEALKNKINTSAIGGVSLRKGLVVVQFVIAQVLVIVTIVVFLQINFFKNTPKGFNTESIVTVALPKDTVLRSHLQGFKNIILQQPGVAAATLSYTAPSSRRNNTTSFRFENSVKDESFEVNSKFADTSYLRTYHLTLIAGRNFRPTDTTSEFLVNERFLAKMGIKSPQEVLGKTMRIGGATFPVVGVVRDFHNLSFREEIAPLVISSDTRNYEMISVKLQPGKQNEAIENIAKTYAAFFPNAPLDYQFLDDYMAISYRNEERLAKMTILFSVISLFISCLGLYGLISFLAVQRTKEVGIRKLLGASLLDILLNFYKEFVLLVLLAFIIAGPLAGFAMNRWLGNFVYHIDIEAWIFFVAASGTLITALITLSFQSVKAALVNPVNSLRME